MDGKLQSHNIIVVYSEGEREREGEGNREKVWRTGTQILSQD